MIQPIKKEITVNAAAEHAFRVFTEGLDRWWPKEHHIGKASMKRAVLEPRAGGRWYEVGDDGSECNWGKVLVWEPPQRVVLAWQINAQWQYDAALVTEVELVFTAESPKRTRVSFEHRNLDRFGDAASATRDSMDPGWMRTLELFANEAQA